MAWISDIVKDLWNYLESMNGYDIVRVYNFTGCPSFTAVGFLVGQMK